jgi:hypothetical protein
MNFRESWKRSWELILVYNSSVTRLKLTSLIEFHDSCSFIMFLNQEFRGSGNGIVKYSILTGLINNKYYPNRLLY